MEFIAKQEKDITPDVIQRVQKSFGRALVKKKLMERFYEIFLSSHPKVRSTFKNTDMEKQKDLLRHGLNLMIMFGNNGAMGKTGIDRIAKSHSRKGMNIDPHLYSYWEESLYKALSEEDPEFNAQIKSDWQLVIQKGIQQIVSNY